MEDTDIRFHSGIPVGHKFFAILLAAAVAAAGCAWLMDQSRKSASAAVLAFDPALAQPVDAGIASAKNPAVALADLMLNDPTVAKLAKQAHLASSTPAGQMGEFRSDLQLSQPSAQRLDVRFQAADASQSMALANSIAHVLAVWSPVSASVIAPPAPAQSVVPSAAPVPQAAASQPPPSSHAVSDHPLSEALTNLSAQLSATDQQLDRLAAGGGSSSYTESGQQSLLRSQVGEARRTLRGFRVRYAKDLADPNISARLDEIQQALDSILPGGHRYGFNAAGVSGPELRAERSELRQAIRIVDRETKEVQLAEAVHPASNAQPAIPAAPPSPETNALPSAQVSSSPLPAPPAGIAEQNIPSTPPAGQAPQQPAQSPLSIVRLAAPVPHPPLWPAIVAGALCGFLYLGIAAFAYRRGASDDIYPELRSTPQRMITPADPVKFDDSVAVPAESLHVRTEPRQRAAFVFQPASPEETAIPAEEPAAPAEKRLPSW